MDLIKEPLFHTMNAADGAAGDEPDGAWQAILEDVVTFWNNEHGTDYDPHDTFHEWLNWNEERQSD
jgi:hypothetical protein